MFLQAPSNKNSLKFSGNSHIIFSTLLRLFYDKLHVVFVVLDVVLNREEVVEYELGLEEELDLVLAVVRARNRFQVHRSLVLVIVFDNKQSRHTAFYLNLHFEIIKTLFLFSSRFKGLKNYLLYI